MNNFTHEINLRQQYTALRPTTLKSMPGDIVTKQLRERFITSSFRADFCRDSQCDITFDSHRTSIANIVADEKPSPTANTGADLLFSCSSRRETAGQRCYHRCYIQLEALDRLRIYDRSIS